MKIFQMVPCLLTNLATFSKWYLLLATKFSPLKPPGGYEKKAKRGLFFRGLGGLRGGSPPKLGKEIKREGKMAIFGDLLKI